MAMGLIYHKQILEELQVSLIVLRDLHVLTVQIKERGFPNLPHRDNPQQGIQVYSCVPGFRGVTIDVLGQGLLKYHNRNTIASLT